MKKIKFKEAKEAKNDLINRLIMKNISGGSYCSGGDSDGHCGSGVCNGKEHCDTWETDYKACNGGCGSSCATVCSGNPSCSSINV